jgi:predicted permease
LGVTVGILSGLVPLSLSLRVDLSNTLKSTSRDGGGRRSRIRSALVGLQAALSVMLLVGTGLLARSLYNIRAIDLGLDVDRVITVIRPDSARGPQLEEIARLAEAMPMVTGAALASARPLDDQFGVRSLFDRNGDTLRAALSDIGFVPAEPGYLAVVGTKVIRGRDFTADDRFGAPPVMIVSEELARRFWPSRSPFGECFRIERADAPCYSVVGIAENAHSFHVVEDPKAVFYVPLDQRPDRTESPRALVIRTSGATAAIADQLRRAIGDTVASARRRQVLVMSELLTSDYDPWELGARLFAGFAALALVLAVLGLYGVLSYLVALRSRELGIRIALGADRRRVMGLVVGEGIRQVAIGALAGAAITLAAAGRMSALLFRVSPRDPVIVLASVVVLVGCAVLAAAIPGRRAMAIDPMQAIRDE